MPLTIVLEGKINTTEMRRLGFIKHVTRRDKIWDKEIRKFWSLATVKEMQESLIMIVSVDSKKERRLRRKRGHEDACRKEKKSWTTKAVAGCNKEGVKELGLVKEGAMDCLRWKQRICTSCDSN